MSQIDTTSKELYELNIHVSRACRQLSQNNTQTSATAARKVLASLS
jgi:hypothetical protein